MILSLTPLQHGCFKRSITGLLILEDAVCSPYELEARGTSGGSQVVLVLVGISLTAPCSLEGPPRHQYPLKGATSAKTISRSAV